jgi:uncharacterized damage-inducible protein DinB
MCQMTASGATNSGEANNREDLRVTPLDGYTPEVGRWVWALEDTRAETARLLAGLAPTTLDWIAPEGGNSIGSLLYHVALIEMDWLYTEVLEDHEPWPADLQALFPLEARDAQQRLSAVAGESLATHLDRLRRVRARLLDVFRGMDAAEFRRSRRLERYDVMPEWVLHHLIQHEAEHRGHIGLLRTRAEGMPPPQ